MRPKGTKQDLEARRRRAIAMLLEGKGVREVGRLVGASSSSVSRWRKMYEEHGEEGLKAIRHPGAKPKLTQEDRERLAEILLAGPEAAGFKRDLWTLARVAKVIKREFKVAYHPCHVWRVLRGMGWSCQKPERRARERDEEQVRRWRLEEWPRIKKRRVSVDEAS